MAEEWEIYDEVVPEEKPLSFFTDPIARYLSFGIPGIGMFSEAYLVFSVGNIGSFQKAAFPDCYKTYAVCPHDMITQKIDSYVQIIGIIIGMMLMGLMGDCLGRKWGSRVAVVTMLSGAIMLCFTPYAPDSYSYFKYFLVAQTWFGVGVGGEYPMAAASAAEKAEVNEGLDEYRGRQVVLTFANQGLGNMVNTLVVLVCFCSFGLTGTTLTAGGSKQALSLMYGVGTVALTVASYYRVFFLEESELFTAESAKMKASGKAGFSMKNTMKCLWLYWPRQFAASVGWFCNDFAFYGNKLQQQFFIALLFPGQTAFGTMQWSALNSFVALTGYWTAAYLIDKPWYGRKNMQNIGFFAMFIIYMVIWAQWDSINDKKNLPYGMQWFQGLYYLSSYFNQMGPNCTTWLVAGEVFPTQIRTTNHGIAAMVGKVGAIISTVWIVNITGVPATTASTQPVFLVSAIWAIAGMIVTWLFLPESTGLNLKELDEFHRCLMEDRPQDYTGEAVSPKFLSLYEIYVMKWSRHYQPLPPGKKRRVKGKSQKLGTATNPNTARLEDGNNPIRASMMPIDATPHVKESAEEKVNWGTQGAPNSVAVL